MANPAQTAHADPPPLRQESDRLSATIRELFSQGGVLSEVIPGFTARPGQVEMAQAVAEVLTAQGDGCRMLAVEAGTGTGKTLAYLVPAALSGKRVVISTNTINLQEQILKREVPLLVGRVDPTLTVLGVKGRQNYLCLYRFKQLASFPQGALFGRGESLEKLSAWAAATATGDRSELPWLADDSPLWSQVTATSSQCLGGDCPDFAACFLTKLRQEAARARILVVNHHLFFSDLALRRFGNGEVLPRYQAVIFDEAHHLEDVATVHFGIGLSHFQLIDLGRDLEKEAETLSQGKGREKTVQLARALTAAAGELLELFPRERGRQPLIPLIDRTPGWQQRLDSVLDLLASLSDHLMELGQAKEVWNGYHRRTLEIKGRLAAFTEPSRTDFVYWFERRERTVSLSASPMDVAAEIEESLYDKVEGVVFTSATLSAGGDFSYFSSRLGLPEATRTLVVETPFDYTSKTLLYVPPDDFPPPNHRDYGDNCRELIKKLLLLARGRALVLFTSISAMREAERYLAGVLPFPLLVQGSAPRHILLDRFRHDTHSVLLAVASFWEGIDVPGESLSCVIIDKLPFEVPSDPVIMARIEMMRSQGQNPFFAFQVPRAVLSLRQGLGRLMRSNDDHGLLAVLDVRLFTKGYGAIFRRSLPPSPVTRKIEKVAQFFQRNTRG